MAQQRVKNMCRFTKELDEKLIELVSKNDVLYNSNHAFYKDIGHRDDVWQAISSLVGKSVTDCKTRWRSLRDLYHRKRNGEKKGTTKRRHVWEYMDVLSFLDDRKSTECDTPNENDENSLTVETKPDIVDNDLKPEPSDPVPCPPTKKLKTDCDKKETILKNHSVIDTAFCNTTLQLLRDIKNATNSKQHPVMTFFESMAKTVMGFPPALAAEAKLKVCQIVTEIECRILEESGEYPENFTACS